MLCWQEWQSPPGIWAAQPRTQSWSDGQQSRSLQHRSRCLPPRTAHLHHKRRCWIALTKSTEEKHSGCHLTQQKKTRIKCFEQNCRIESNFLEGSQLKKGTDPLKQVQRRVTKMIRNTSVIRTGWESWWCSAWRREGSVKNLRWPFGTQSWQQTF